MLRRWYESDAAFETRLMLLYENYPDENPTIFRPELHREGFFGVFAHPALLDARQPTLRRSQGHLLRSQITPDAVVTDAKVWAALEFQ